MRQFTTLLTLLLVLITTTLPAQSPTLDSLDRALTQLAADGYFSGALLLAEGDRLLLRKAYGYADFANEKPLTPDNVFELASVSKQFTAAAIAKLAGDGKLDLDRPVMSYLPELAAYPTLTTRQLVHHTGGLPDYMSAAGEIEELPDFVTNQFVLDYLRDQKPAADFTPGARYDYSNTGYLVLASLVERVSGRTFTDYLESELFAPLGMTNSTVYRRRYEADRSVANFAPGYVWTGEAYAIPDSLEGYEFVSLLDGIQGDGMVNSTLDDLHRWQRALLTGAAPLDTTLLFASGRNNAGEAVAYGFGQQVRQHPKYGYTVSHSGGWPGVATFTYLFPETGRSLILLRNDGGGRSERVNPLRNALHVLHGMPLETESLSVPKARAVDPAKVADLLGVYAISPDFKLRFFVNDGQFMTQATGQPALALRTTPIRDRFSLIEVRADVLFHRDAAGKVTGLTLYQGGQEVKAEREE